MKINIDTTRPLQIFDLGNVLIEVDARRTLAAFEKLGMPHTDVPISNSHAVGGCFSLYGEGRISTDDFLSSVKTDFCPMATTDQLTEAWNAMLGDFFTSSIDTILALRKQGYQLALLSNCCDLHTEYCRQHFPGPGTLDGLFDAVFYSQEIHLSKPNPRTWLMVLEHFGRRADEAAFYDDSEVNVIAAQSLGISASVVK